MKYLILLDEYWPFPDANGLCIDNIIHYLNAEMVTVICRVSDEKILEEYLVDDKRILPIYFEREKSFFDRGWVGKIIYIIKHILRVFFFPIYDRKLMEMYFNVANKEIKKRKYDCVITVLNPIEAVTAGKLIKEDNTKMQWLIYDLDTVSNCSLGKIEDWFKRIYNKKILKWEREVFSEADYIVHLESHKKHFSQAIYQEFKDKTIFQGVPLLNISRTKIKNNEPKRNTLLYAGRFYNRLREPDVLFNIVEKAIEIDASIELDVYTKDDSVEDLCKNLLSNKIHIHGFVSQEILDDIITRTDILISIGNRTTIMFPSKIVSYVAKLKPIVHIYQNINDPVIPFLNNYSNALLLDGSLEAEINARKLIEFLLENHRELSADDIEHTYRRYTGWYCAQEICDYMSIKKGR